MLNKFKKIINTLLVAIIMCSFINPVNAASCTDKTYYSRKDYVSHHNLVDVSFGENDLVITNSIGIPFSVDAFGPLNFPKRVNSDVLIGPSTKTFSSNGGEQYFLFRTNGKIKVKNIESKVYAVNKDGSFASYKVYANSYYTSAEGFVLGPQIGSGNDNSTLNLSFNGGYSLDSIMIRFDNPANIDHYVVDNFQITEYLHYEHIEWVDYYIPNTETKVEKYCVTDGKYDPDGNTKWEDMVLTTFTAKADAIFDYLPQFSYEDPWAALDYNKEQSWSYGSLPDLRYSGLSPDNAQYIRGYRHAGGSEYRATDANGSDFIYSSDGKSAVVYKIYQRHWTPGGSPGDAQPGWFSSDAAWCNDTTGQFIGACVKHDGHHWNARYNTFDITLVYYRAIADSLQQVATTTYTLNVYDRNNSSYVLRTTQNLGSVTGETTKDFTLTDTGIYTINAYVRDKAGNSINKTSKYFHLDTEVPEIHFEADPLNGGWHTGNFNIKYRAYDRYSGVNRIRETKLASNDGKSWVALNTPNEVVYNYGITDKRVDMNNKQSMNMSSAISVQKAYRYYKVAVEVEDVFGNKLKSTSPVYKYDNINPSIEIIGYNPPRFKDDGSLNYTNQDVTITVKVSDNESGLDVLDLVKNNGSLQQLKKYAGEKESVNSFVFTTNIYDYMNYYLRIKDRAGNSAQTKLVIDTIDKEPPTPSGDLTNVCGSIYIGADQVDIKFTDNYSGVAYFEYKTIYRDSWGQTVDSDWIRVDGDSTKVYIPEAAMVSFEVRAYDKAGNAYRLDNCSYEVQHIYDPETALVDYDYIFGLYDDMFGEDAPVTDMSANQFISVLESDKNEAAQSCIKFLKDTVKTEDCSKTEALIKFFEIFHYNQRYTKNPF